jgi:hypothetical protein
MVVGVGDDGIVEELLAELAVLKHELAQAVAEVGRLQQAPSMCCPWWKYAWHRAHERERGRVSGLGSVEVVGHTRPE